MYLIGNAVLLQQLQVHVAVCEGHIHRHLDNGTAASVLKYVLHLGDYIPITIKSVFLSYPVHVLNEISIVCVFYNINSVIIHM